MIYIKINTGRILKGLTEKDKDWPCCSCPGHIVAPLLLVLIAGKEGLKKTNRRLVGLRFIIFFNW